MKHPNGSMKLPNGSMKYLDNVRDKSFQGLSLPYSPTDFSHAVLSCHTQLPSLSGQQMNQKHLSSEGCKQWTIVYSVGSERRNGPWTDVSLFPWGKVQRTPRQILMSSVQTYLLSLTLCLDSMRKQHRHSVAKQTSRTIFKDLPSMTIAILN